MGTNITGIGNANAIGFKSRVTGGAYFPPELKDALVGVWSAYGKSNDSTDRNIIKNKIKDKGGDLELLNFNYKEGSGYGKYEIDFTTWRKSTKITKNDSFGFSFSSDASYHLMYYYTDDIRTDIPSFKFKLDFVGTVCYYIYINEQGKQSTITYNKPGIYDTPISYNSKYIGNNIAIGFTTSGGTGTLTQIPEFKGAVVMDSVDDIIVSQKSVQEMLGGSNEITVISMIHQIGGNKVYTHGYTNYIRHGGGFIRNRVSGTDGNGFNKTGIYGYTATKLNTSSMNLGDVVNNMLGDKGDYTFERSSTYILDDAKYSVSNFINANDRPSNEGSELAWYWTFIANRVLTEDEINLVIEKYNLDRPGEIVKPQVYYNVKKQKITNDNHSAFDDKLIDYSGNGYDAKLYNFNWDKQSGVGSYPISFKDYTYVSSRATVQVNRDNFIITSNSNTGNFLEVNTKNKTLPIYKVKVEGTNTITNGVLSYRFNNTEGVISRMSIPEDGEYEIPESPSTVNSVYSGWCINGGTNDNIEVKVTVIPEYKDSLVFDGVDDYGKVTGLPVLKDYTIAVYRKWLQNYQNSGSLVSKSNVAGSGSFLMEQKNYNNISATYSYGARTENLENPNLDKDIYTYQSKYIYNGVPLTAGTGVDGTDMWLATIRDRDERFSSFALKTLMLFPYSLSEFLLERQIEKIKSGTLYPDMVEFRPIVSEDENITGVKYFSIDSAHNWIPISPGDYLPVGQHIAITVNTVLPYKVSAASSSQLTISGISQSAGGYNAWDIHAYMKKGKTPQKIRLTTAVNETIVRWNPTIIATIPDSYDAVTEWFINGWETKIAAGYWIKKTDRIFFKLKLKKPLHEIGKVTFGGSECQASKASNWSESNNLWEIVTYSSVRDLSQVFNVQIDEYIRYEDIVQPYPVLLRFNDENGNEVSWGGKFRVGSTITRIGSIADPESNLLNGLYSISGLSLNGKAVTSSTSIVEKQMVFKTTTTWLLDNNEPKVILSPSRLRIPNSSYKLLGYIPDISGHGNHGKINNSAYSGESGANGYVENFTKWIVSKPPMTVEKTDSQVRISYIGTSYKELPMFEYSGLVNEDYSLTVEVQGIPNNVIGKFIHNNGFVQEITNGINTIKFSNSGSWYGFTFYREDNSIIGDCDITIQQIGEYDGAFCLDGVDDFITIPTVTGGKQVLMKVNWQKEDGMIYNQNPGQDNFAIFANDYNGSNVVNAYASRNNGSTYIDGTLNNNILATRLKNVTHNITIANENVVDNTIVPVIGANAAHNNFYARMALYDFMLFDNISTDDKIKELNEHVGIEGNVFAFNPPTFTIDLPMAIKNIKVYQGGSEISPGYLYLNKDTEFEVYVSLNEGKYALDTITVDGVEIIKDRVVGEYNIFKFILNGSSEQKITIHSYEYVMYEDIPQPYPAFFYYNDKKTKKDYSWGDKVKIGSIVNVRSIDNVLYDLYTINAYVINGESLNYSALISKDITIDNNLTVNCSTTYKLSGSAPKCIFSPSKLRIPNSSYKYLGYMPDISGNGNNGVFNNFAFSGMSGANGYLEDFTMMKDYGTSGIVRTESKIYLNESFNYKEGFWLGYTNNPSPAYKVKVSGIPETGMLTYTGGIWLNLVNGINELPARTNTAENHGFVVQSPGLDWSKLVIEQVGNYEGAICFDGIDDYVTIPTLSKGGKQMLMKVNWQSSVNTAILYDQRGNGGFAIVNGDIAGDGSTVVFAYEGRNPGGKTYIDGILNKHMYASQLKDITHNITATYNPSFGAGNTSPRLGYSVYDASYSKMALYDFMLFDEVNTNEEIKQLNNIIGIEGNYVQRPPYYWDAYGKTNLDGDRETIPQLGTAEGYSFDSFDNTLDWYNTPNNDSVDVVSRNKYSITLKKLSGTNYWYFQNSTAKRMFSKEIPFKLKANKAISVIWDVHGLSISEGKDKSSRVQEIVLNPNEDISTKLKPLTKEELAERGISTNGVYYLLWFELSTLTVDEEVTIEMLPVEGGRNLWFNNYGFAYDKMSGFGGYEFAKFDNTSEWSARNREDGIEVIERNAYSFTAKRIGVGTYFWDFNNHSIKTLNRPLTLKAVSNNNTYVRWEFKYRTAEKPDVDSTIILVQKEMTPNVPITVTLPYKTEQEITDLGVTEGSAYYLFYFDPTNIPIGEEYTVEMLPLYPNALLFDGVDDYSKALNIVAPTDYTYIFQRELLGNTTGSVSMYSGWFQASGGGAFIADYSINSGGATDGMYGFSFGRNAKVPSLATDKIIYGTTTSVNGTDIIPGPNLATGNSITLGQWDVNYKKMAFYKLFLYPRTIDMLSINMVKNMMEEGGIIDITSKLFTDKYTGDYDFKDFNNDFFIGD